MGSFSKGVILMPFVHFPKSVVPNSPTATRNLYVNSLSVDLVYQDSTDLTKTAIVTGEVVQWVSLPIATVISMLNKA